MLALTVILVVLGYNDNHVVTIAVCGARRRGF